MVAAASLVMEMEEVLEARMVEGLQGEKGGGKGGEEVEEERQGGVCACVVEGIAQL